MDRMDKKKETEEIFEELSSSFDEDREEQELLYKKAEADLHKLQKKRDALKRKYKEASKSADELSQRLRESERYNKHHIPLPNGRVDYLERKNNSFASGISFNKLFIVFFIGSFLGVVIELGWCYIRHGYFESRQAFVWGPFNPVYGLGALFMTLFLYKYRNRSVIYSFVGAMVIGTVLEYVLSFLQERFLGSVSWDYSSVPLNLNGRVCLLYSIFWGLIGIAWIKLLYPYISAMILKIPKRIGDNIVTILLIFMIIDAVLSLSAVYRWSGRIKGEKPFYAYEYVLDRYFPDERMDRVYPNMVFVGK